MEKPILTILNQRIARFRKRIGWLAMVLLLLVFIPYLYSRMASVANRITVIESRAINADAVDAEPSGIRVACYNVAHGRGLAKSNWRGGDDQTRLERLDEIADLLRQIDADVVVLNEVDFDASWSNSVNQAKRIAEKAGYAFRVEQRNLDFRILHRTWRFGNAILSRYPVSNAQVIDLPSYAGIETALAGKKRGMSCDVQVGPKVLTVFGLHLSHRSEHVRELSALKVIESVKKTANPCVVMGDMNSTPLEYPFSNSTNDGRNAIETFDQSNLFVRNQIEGAIPASELTFRSNDPKSIIDWILVSKKSRFKSYEVVESLLSDHRPVVAELRIAQ